MSEVLTGRDAVRAMSPLCIVPDAKGPGFEPTDIRGFAVRLGGPDEGFTGNVHQLLMATCAAIAGFENYVETATPGVDALGFFTTVRLRRGSILDPDRQRIWEWIDAEFDLQVTAMLTVVREERFYQATSVRLTALPAGPDFPPDVAERALKLAGVQLPSTPRARELVFSVVVPDRDDAIKTAELLSAQLGFYCAGVEYVESDTDAATIPLYNRVPGSTDPASAAGSGPADGGDPAAD